ncbi:MAG: hypothetical protein RIA62_00625 [Cyclobacteriaceae bacterium]
MKHQIIKDQLFKLISESENEYLLKMVHEILSKDEISGDHPIHLTEDQEKELLQSYEESLDESNLIDLEELKSKNSKWLGK